MINILISAYNFHEEWAQHTFKRIINSSQKVIVIPLSFRENEIQNLKEWENFYGKKGTYYQRIVDPFIAYGINEENIKWLNYYSDSPLTAANKIHQSDIIFLTGGLPDLIISRLGKLELTTVLKNYQGILIGASAGAMIQCQTYFISPDLDYPSFLIKQGLNIIDNFAIEVHYRGSEAQKNAIKRYINECGKPVYAITEQGAVVVTEERLNLVGGVAIFANK